MTDIISRNADFSGGRIIGYTPPADGMDYFGWFGGTLADSLRNFGSGDAAQFQGALSNLGEFYLDLSGAGYIQTELAPSMAERTVFVVGKQVVPGSGSTQKCIFASTEENLDAGGRQGSTVYSGAADRFTLIRYLGDGTNGSGGASATAKSSDTTNWQAFCARQIRNSDGSVTLEMRNLTTGAVTTGTTIGAGDVVDYQEQPIRIGTTYRTDSGAFSGPARVACVGIAERALTTEEIDKLYQSAKRRLASFGVTI